MALLNLPTEVLLELADFLAESDVNSFCQANWRLYDILNPYLYRNNARNFGSSALIWASGNGKSATVKRVFETVTTQRQSDVKRAFFEALQNGNAEVIKIFLEKRSDIDVDAKVDDDQTPLFIAAGYGYTPLVKLLLDTEKVDINANFHQYGTPLGIAAFNGHVEVVGILLDTGRADTEAMNRCLETPIYAAATNGRDAVIELFIQRGVDLEAEYDGARFPGLTLREALIETATVHERVGAAAICQLLGT
ncbi:serine/threonine-protein phosphatase 6 regulatory ankyrin repeat subunit C [Penicillium frequentans]|uniref:Serine/threonine-protein phosphatase 6 regulatory ankyrin repeat subunit C n=1 Tax=Penicillium frequentans TaxID=3151616 RepID=A0AAD6CZN0_9EURO|nr:serine/threonine-protein phosphatase 6 regulatory ankyrin repeat subunit C [Penicillium glabrum]